MNIKNNFFVKYIYPFFVLNFGFLDISWYFCFIDFLGIVGLVKFVLLLNFWIFWYFEIFLYLFFHLFFSLLDFLKLLRLLLTVTKVTTEHQKWPKIGQSSIICPFFGPKCKKKPSDNGRSPKPEICLRSGPYLLVAFIQKITFLFVNNSQEYKKN